MRHGLAVGLTLRLSRGRLLQVRLASSTAVDPRKAYSHTLLLPKTTLPLKHKDPVQVERDLRPRTTDELYRKQATLVDRPSFILHDGPPYANGSLHMGHALNRILKDIINRYQLLRGSRIHYVPGWDCHGLPIENKALKDLGSTPRRIRDAARQTALDAIAVQKKEMRELGIMADWDAEDGVYVTMNNKYEIRQLRLFQKMVEKGYVSYRLRPTYYSPSSRTALAEAELKYTDDHQSRSVYVGFPVEEMAPGLKTAYEQACPQASSSSNLRLAIWTTTPWSLPGNAGIAIREDLMYVLARYRDQVVVIADGRLDAMRRVLGSLNVLGRLPGIDLIGTRYSHLFGSHTVFSAEHVTEESGTGLVHSAPAHGYEDYQAFVRAGILPDKMPSPIDDAGRFTAEVGIPSLEGKEVLGDAVDEMIRLLQENGMLLAEETVEHRYPYDWKTKQPIIVRATPQWFANVEAIKQRGMQALDRVRFVPEHSRNRLEAFVLSRSEWCISRQRSWGVPIPALFDGEKPVMTTASMSHIIDVLETKGTDYWWDGPIEDFVPSGEKLVRGGDTLDVWFDSGTSWTLLDGVADVYLEGSDQHRGWFQSSLLTRLAVDEDAPYRNLITHGFILDEEGNKMSKSAGNGISPVDVVNGTEGKPGLGADTIRLWAASVDYARDVSIGPSSIAHAGETLRKLRSALRFMLANAGEGDDAELSMVDHYVLHKLAEVEAVVQEAYDNFAFNKALQSMTTFVSGTLSAFYFDMVKDSLYCDGPGGIRRRAAVLSLSKILRSVVSMLAPMTPYLSEEIYAQLGKTSVFLEVWKPNGRPDPEIERRMKPIMSMRAEIQSMIEQARTKKLIKSGAQADVWLDGWHGEDVSELAPIFGVSNVYFGKADTLSWVESASVGEVTLTLGPSALLECPRCWLHRAEARGELCERCGVEIHGEHPRLDNQGR